jgi:hypothetical protein
VVVQDPDGAVLLAVDTVSERFSALGNASGVLRHFIIDDGLRLPRIV